MIKIDPETYLQLGHEISLDMQLSGWGVSQHSFLFIPFTIYFKKF